MEKKIKDPVFYGTQIENIEREIMHYRSYFEGKMVYCPCDNPDTSNFWKYFKQEFRHLKLAGLVSTFYTNKGSSTVTIFDGKKCTTFPLKGNGDFTSDECRKIMVQADVIVTNPAFGIWEAMFHQITNHGKDFIMIGHVETLANKDVFPKFVNGDFWVGVNQSSMKFFDPTKKQLTTIGQATWLTNINHGRSPKPLQIDGLEYEDRLYPKYDTFDAIEVDYVRRIPDKYEGKMGVPISFLLNDWRRSFDVLGIDRYIDGNKEPGRRFYRYNATIKGKFYKKKEMPIRVVIQHKQSNPISLPKSEIQDEFEKVSQNPSDYTRELNPRDPELRNRAFETHGRNCMGTGRTTALQCCHVVPLNARDSDLSPSQLNHVGNVVVLSVDLHVLYDAVVKDEWMLIDGNGRIYFSQKVKDDYAACGWELPEKLSNIEHVNRDYLEENFQYMKNKLGVTDADLYGDSDGPNGGSGNTPPKTPIKPTESNVPAVRTRNKSSTSIDDYANYAREALTELGKPMYYKDIVAWAKSRKKSLGNTKTPERTLMSVLSKHRKDWFKAYGKGYYGLAEWDNPTSPEPTKGQTNGFTQRKAKAAARRKQLQCPKIDPKEAVIRREIESSINYLKNTVRMVATGESKGKVISGGPGIGKTYITNEVLQEMNVPYKSISGTATVPEFFMLLYEYRNDVVVVDDCDGLFTDRKGLNILKAATDTNGTRTISYLADNKTMRNEDIPKEFVFEGRIIILTNCNFNNEREWPNSLKPHVKAIVSRCMPFELGMRDKVTKQVLMNHIIETGDLEKLGVKSKQMAYEIRDFIIEHGISPDLRIFHTLAPTWDNTPEGKRNILKHHPHLTNGCDDNAGNKGNRNPFVGE